MRSMRSALPTFCLISSNRFAEMKFAITLSWAKRRIIRSLFWYDWMEATARNRFACASTMKAASRFSVAASFFASSHVGFG